MTIFDEFSRVSAKRPCPICKKPDWCLVSRDDDSRAICQRVPSEKRWGEAGFLHELQGVTRRRRWRELRLAIPISPFPRTDFSRVAEHYSASVDPDALHQFAFGLSLSISSLMRLRVGSSGTCWTFPMVEADGSVVGIRLRRPDGSKFSARGGHEGLFVPTELQAKARVLVCEGPSDTAAMLDLGFEAVGRPSCTGGARLITELFKTLRPAEVVVVGDNDPAGHTGAMRLWLKLTTHFGNVRAIFPPLGAKDARAWKQAGATHEVVEAAIAAAPIKKVVVTSRRVRR